MPTSRQQLAKILSFRFREKKIQTHYVAKSCRVPVDNVGKWLDGTLVPNNGEWGDLRRFCFNDLSKYNNLWQAAKVEQVEEHKTKTNGHSLPSKVATNLGEKLAEAGASTAPTPTVTPVSSPAPAVIIRRPTETMIQTGQEPRGVAKDGRLLSPLRPYGSMTTEAQADRRKFTKGILLQRPNIRLTGSDGLQALVRQRFGIGINPKIIEEIREEIALEQTRPTTSTPLVPAPEVIDKIPEVAALPPLLSTVATATHSHKDLQAGIELILNAVPGLQQLTITVDDKGEASVDFQIRKVEIQTIGGSIKVRPR